MCVFFKTDYSNTSWLSKMGLGKELKFSRTNPNISMKMTRINGGYQNAIVFDLVDVLLLYSGGSSMLRAVFFTPELEKRNAITGAIVCGIYLKKNYDFMNRARYHIVNFVPINKPSHM